VNYLKQVQKGIDYIEANLDQDITAYQVATEAGISQWHFQRIFKALTNETLKTYIRSRRLANSLAQLLATDTKIIDISLAAGYESQESFSRAFKAAFDITPNEYRKLGDKNLFLRKIHFDEAYLKHINKNVSLNPEIYRQDSMRLVGLKTRFYSIDSEKNNIGNRIPPLWDSFLGRINEIKNTVPDICYGVIQQTQDKTDLLEYYAAIEVTELEQLPEKMISIEIPTSSYAKFTHMGVGETINNTVNYIYTSWLLKSGKQHTYGPDLEIYGPEYLPVSENSVMHYAIPIE